MPIVTFKVQELSAEVSVFKFLWPRSIDQLLEVFDVFGFAAFRCCFPIAEIIQIDLSCFGV